MDRHNETAGRAAPFEQLGQWDDAAQLYAAAYRDALSRRNISDAVAALRRQAWNRWQQGELDQAEELAILSREIAERNGLVRATAWALNLLAAIRYSQQDFTTAANLYTAAQELAFDLGDDELIGLTFQNLGILLNVQGNLREAKATYLESVGSAVRSAKPRNAMMVYANLGLVCADLHDWMEAEVYLDRGIEIAEQLGDVPVGAKLRANRAEPLIHTGQLAQATKTLDTAEQLATQAGDTGTLADIARFRAMIAREEGHLEFATKHITYSLQLAMEGSLNLEHAEALEERACLLDAEGRIEEAFATLHEAHEAYQALGAERDATRTREILDSWSSRKSTVASTPP